jgi:hypothetical protein
VDRGPDRVPDWHADGRREAGCGRVRRRRACRAGRALPAWPATLARGESWPLSWHRDGDAAAVLFVRHSARVPRWRRPRFDLLLADLFAEDGGQFACSSVDGMGPGLADDPFGPPPAVTDGFVEGGTAERVTVSEAGGPPTRHAVGWGRSGTAIRAVELRTDVSSVRVPVTAPGGYFVVVAPGGAPVIVLHATTGEVGTTP